MPSYGTDFYFLDYTKYRESIASAQKIDFQILIIELAQPNLCDLI